MSTQLSFQNGMNKFGGELQGRRKSARPLSRKHVVHVVMKSSQARGLNSLSGPRHARMVRRVLRLQSKKTDVQILKTLNLGSYLHLTLKIPTRKAYADFIRAVSGLIARSILQKERGEAKTLKSKPKSAGFWDSRPLTQILQNNLSWSSVFRQLQENLSFARRMSAEIFRNSLSDPPIHSTA